MPTTSRLFVLPVVLSLSLQACAHSTSQQLTSLDDEAAQPVVSYAPPTSAVTPPSQRADTMYLLMQAELAGRKGRVSEAGKLYLQAAEMSRDPRLAERALKIALLSKDTTTSEQALALWYQLEAQNQDRWLFEVLLAERQRDDERALRLITQNLPSNPQARKETYQQILGTLIREGAGILPLLHAVTKAYPDDADAWFTLAQAALHFRESDTAQAALRKTIHLDPKRKDAYLLLAESYFSQKNSEAGIAILSDMQRQFPDDARLNMLYARALHEAGRSAESRELLGKMLKQSPKDQDLRLAYALISLESGDFASAERELKTLQRQKERSAAAAFYLGRLEEQRGNNTAALRWYAQAQGGEFAIESLLRMAQIDFKEGRITPARQRLNQARALSPSDEERVRLFLLEAQLLRQSERMQEAFDLLNQALNESAGEPDLLYSRALLADQLGQHAEAEADLRAILAQDPQNPEALNALGFLLADRNVKLDEAYVLISQSLKLDPKNAATIDSMGWVLFRMGKFNEAEEYLRKAYAQNQDAEIAYHLVETLIALQRENEARQLLADALKRDPHDARLRKQEAQLRGHTTP